MAIIQALTDTDLYKLTMMQTILHQFPHALAEYSFKCRNKGINLAKYKDQIEQEVDALCRLRFTEPELSYLASLDYLKSDFIQFLRLFQLNRDYIAFDTAGCDLVCRIKGPMLHSMAFEIYVLAIVNEVYFRNEVPVPDHAEGTRRLAAKIEMIRNHPGNKRFRFSDFGTRRRFSGQWQELVVRTLKSELPANFTGTSNVYLAMTHDLLPVGTMAHEYLQACQQLGVRLIDSQKFALETWVKEYRGRLGIALTDVVGMDAFFRDFDLYFAKLFDGLRHDSGDPYLWARKAIEHYQKLKIDPRTKTLVFSDGLTFERSLDLYDTFKDQAGLAFGHGTDLTNDLGYEALQIVIKMVLCNGQPVAKVSDSPGKGMCEYDKFLHYLTNVFQIDEKRLGDYR
jgi:nicotinate phosphoribosyltransferase